MQCVLQLLAAAPEAALVSDNAGWTPLAAALEQGHACTAHRVLSLGALQPAGELLRTLQRIPAMYEFRERAFKEAALPLYAVVAARQPLTAAEWGMVPWPLPALHPFNCPGTLCGGSAAPGAPPACC